jgi:hypothetical protein
MTCRGSLDQYFPTSLGPAPRKSPPVQPVAVRFANGHRATLPVVVAASLVARGRAEVTGDMDEPTTAAFRAALESRARTLEERTRP